MKYRKLPVEIDAIRWNGTNKNEIDLFTQHSAIWTDGGQGYYLHIPTLEGSLLASIGDYIIKGIQGEFYPCKPDIFKQTYESVV